MSSPESQPLPQTLQRLPETVAKSVMHNLISYPASRAMLEMEQVVIFSEKLVIHIFDTVWKVDVYVLPPKYRCMRGEVRSGRAVLQEMIDTGFIPADLYPHIIPPPASLAK